MTIDIDARPWRTPSIRTLAGLAYPHWGLWVAVCPLVLVNLLWISTSERLSLAPGGFAYMAAPFLGLGLTIAYAQSRGPALDRLLTALCRGLMLALLAGAITQQVNLFSHLGMSLGMPLADGLLAAWDRALGFDWNLYAQTMAAQPWSRAALRFAYFGLIPPAFGLILGIAIWTDRHDRVVEVAVLVLASGVICVAAGALFPAEDAWNSLATPETRALLGGEVSLAWFHQFLALRGGGSVALDPSRLEGIVSFPSYHAALAAIIIWCSRGSVLGLAAGLACGLAVLLATPIYGAHYAIDLAGGVAVVAGCVLVWRRIGPARRESGE